VLANGDVIPFTAGERGLVVDVSRPKGPFVVEGRVLSDTCTRSGVPHATGLAVVARTESTAKRATVDLDGGFAFAFQDDEPVTLELRDGWRGVLEGRADLRPLALGVVRDPPLIIDLRGRLRSIVVRGEDASGRPLGISVREASGPARSPVFGPPSEQTILVDRPSVDLVVSAYGWRDVRVDGVEDDLVVRFDVPARHIALVWPEIPKVPIDVRMRPIVIPRDAWTEDDQYAVFDLHGACFDTEGRASTVTGATGTMRVFLVVELRRGGGSWSHAYADEPIELEADAGLHGPVEVRWDPDEVASRIRELREM
jgi:hypothetical protein